MKTKDSPENSNADDRLLTRSADSATALGRMAHPFDAGVLQMPHRRALPSVISLWRVRVDEMSKVRRSEVSLKRAAPFARGGKSSLIREASIPIKMSPR